MKPLPVSIIQIGTGHIGGTVLPMLRNIRESWRDRYGIDVRIRSVIDSSGGVACDEPDAFSATTLDKLAAARSQGVKIIDAATQIGLTPRSASDAVRIALESGPGICIDCASGTETSDLANQAVRGGFGGVFSNKAPLSLPQIDPRSNRLWPETALGGRVRYETTCGAGLPVISSLQAMLATGDQVLQIEGMLSGTLGAILADVQAGTPFSEAVRSAREKGFTEPDPRDDLTGLDVARKALILARTIGLQRDLEDIQIESLVPVELSKVSVDEFLEGIRLSDSKLSQRATVAQEGDAALKYVARVSATDPIMVGLQPVPNSTLLGSLQGPENIITIRTSRYNEYPLNIVGPGAGAAVTAAGVVADVLSLARTLEAP